MDLGYTNKVVGVTGATALNGIGFAIAKQMLLEGARVFICGRREAAVVEAVKHLSEYGVVQGYVADVSQEQPVKDLFAAAMHDFGKIDVFINNAGVYPQRSLMEMTMQEWDGVMETNLRSVFLCAKEFWNCAKDQGGVLINASSFAAILGSAGSGAYAASKAAVHSLTKTLAAEFAPYGIRVNGFVPGVIATDMTAPVIAAKADKLLSQIALHRLGNPEEVAKAVTFLGSDAANYITGTFLEISGGKLCVQSPDSGY